jgi:hypothetical protein
MIVFVQSDSSTDGRIARAKSISVKKHIYTGGEK